MFTGQIMIYAGIGMVAVSLLLLLILTIVFRTGRKKLKNKIYSEYQED
ncbi:MAG: hypothetical protein IJ397_08170 [Lachnospiraceae bacterium]|nr:hypothetical protein [Lachnospiraceae bacterium]